MLEARWYISFRGIVISSVHRLGKAKSFLAPSASLALLEEALLFLISECH